MLGVSLRDHIQNDKNRKGTKVDDDIEHIARQKWRWVGHVTRQDNDKWTRRIVQWRPRQHKKVLVVHRNDGLTK